MNTGLYPNIQWNSQFNDRVEPSYVVIYSTNFGATYPTQIPFMDSKFQMTKLLRKVSCVELVNAIFTSSPAASTSINSWPTALVINIREFGSNVIEGGDNSISTGLVNNDQSFIVPIHSASIINSTPQASLVDYIYEDRSSSSAQRILFPAGIQNPSALTISITAGGIGNATTNANYVTLLQTYLNTNWSFTLKFHYY